VDARTNETLVDIAWGRNHAITLSEPRIEDGSTHSDLSILDHQHAITLDTTTLTLPATIGRRSQIVVPVTGGVLVGFGEVSVFVRTEN
jgi:hypothetical protein